MPFGKDWFLMWSLCAYRVHGRTFGIATVTSTSRNMRPVTNPSRTQSSACHQSS